jgi:hypothetical protein
MAILDLIKEMEQQGMKDEDIAQKLKEQGLNAREIDDALNQSKIKAAVYEGSGPEAVMENAQNEMQPSMMTQSPEAEQAAVYPQYQQQQYSQEAYYQPPQSGISPDTITEIAEQVVSEKLADLRKNIGKVTEFKSMIESRVTGAEERLKKIESTIDRLQSAILEKVSGYGESIQDMSQEMEGMQESFSKVINPMMDKARSHIEKNEKNSEEVPPEQPEAQKQQKSQKRKPGFEDFLR